MNEAALRDELATKLEILEPGLVLIEKECPLPNPLGAKGFVDILARDRFGNRVIIELKRSNQTARQALHEILKYVALFVGHHGISRDRIRCFIVSTEWHELLVPFAQFMAVATFQAQGYHLLVDSTGIVSASSVEIPDLPEPISPFEHHGAFLFSQRSARDASAPRVQSALSDCGATAYIILLQDYEGNSPEVVYPFSIYVVPLRLQQKAMGDIRESVEREYADCDLDSSEISQLVQQTFHSQVNEAVRDFHDTYGRGFTYEIGFPEKLSRGQYDGWRCREVIRFGNLGEAAADDEEILRLVSGIEGQSDVRFYRTSSPRIELGWQSLRTESARCFLGNPAWQDGFQWFCEWIETDWKEATVAVAVYNPMNLLVSLHKLCVHGDTGYLPMLELIAVEEDQQRCRFLFGAIQWDGRTCPASVDETFGDVEEFLFQTAMGVAWESDADIMQRHGLSYGLARGEIADGQFKGERIAVDAKGGGVTELCDDDIQSLPRFLEACEPYLGELTRLLHSAQSGL